MNIIITFSLFRFASYVQSRLHLFVILSCLGLGLMGRMPESSAGWLIGETLPSAVGGITVTTGRRKRRRPRRVRGNHTHSIDHVVWHHVRNSWRVPLLRSGLLGLLWHWSGGEVWLIGLPWATWGWNVLGLGWPWLRRQAEWRAVHWLGRQLERLVLIWALSWPLRAGFRMLMEGQVLPTGHTPWLLGAGVACGSETPAAVNVAVDEDGGYTATLTGHFTLHVASGPFRKRLLILFLRLLEVPGQTRGSRRTRDGRTPFVRQQDLAADFGIPQPDISRWERYWLAGDWRRLLSVRSTEVLTLELQAQIVRTFAQFPWWGVKKIYQHLHEQGVAVSHSQVRQAAEESGWSLLRQELRKRYHLTAESFRPRDKWLTTKLLTQVQDLLGQLEAGSGLTTHIRIEIADLQAFCEENGVAVEPPLKTMPWMLRIESVLFGSWEKVTGEQVSCIYCGSTNVARKSRTPRLKKYYDSDGNVQTVEVFRYYCHNPECDKTTFTNLPVGLVPYSPYRMETRLLSIQMYAWGYSTYRRTATAMGVAPFTVYRWVSALGGELLPVAAIFGVVRSSGVIGVDEKFVLVPKNDKPKSKMSRWMYVYLAVDMYTYDLLHIAIYPYNNEASARAFLLAVRAKGYIPSTLVTDLRQDYGAVITQVFPQATHHECIFHALQNVQTHFKEIYGADYAKDSPQAVALKQEIYNIFDARTRRTARKRYAAVLAKRDEYVARTPGAVAIFDFLERHWPKLINAIENPAIPRTNNVTELVIRRFDQHYQNFCGFENIESAHLYLAVFEKLYRFTPFSNDAQERIRGKCPLELAGYDISDLPMTSICSGLSADWPTEVALVPN